MFRLSVSVMPFLKVADREVWISKRELARANRAQLRKMVEAHRPKDAFDKAALARAEEKRARSRAKVAIFMPKIRPYVGMYDKEAA